MNNIKNKLSDGNKVAISVEEYLERLAILFEGKYLEEQKNVSKIITDLKKESTTEADILETAMLIEKNTDLHKIIISVFDTYEQISNYFLGLQYMIDVLNLPYLQSENNDTADVSQTYKLETNNILRKILLSYNNYVKKHTGVDEALLEEYSNVIIVGITNGYLSGDTKLNTAAVEKIINLIQAEFYKNKNTVLLYSTVLQKLIDILYDLKKPEAKQIMFSVIDMIESDKDFFISGNCKNTLTSAVNKHIHLVNPALKRFGLVPVTDSMLMDDLLELIIKNKSIKNVDLHKYSKENDIGFIIVKRVVYTPIEYDLRNLIIPELAKPLIQPPEFGITEKTINRFQTIKILPSADDTKDNKKSGTKGSNKSGTKDNKKSGTKGSNKSGTKGSNKSGTQNNSSSDRLKWDFSYEIIGEKLNNFYILETLDNKHYRALAPWMSDKNLAIGRFRIKQFIEYISNPNKPNRIANYQALANKAAIKNMFLAKSMSLDLLAERSTEVDTTLIKNEIFLKINRVISDMITDEYAEGKKIKSDTQLNDIIHHFGIRDAFVNTVLRLYEVGAKYDEVQDFDAGKFPFYELLSSFMVDLEDISRRFMKDLHDGYNRDPLKKEVFDLPPYEKASAIGKKLEDILNKTIQTVISDKENIYSALNYKYLLLNYH
jgi:hypothetical protein